MRQLKNLNFLKILEKNKSVLNNNFNDNININNNSDSDSNLNTDTVSDTILEPATHGNPFPEIIENREEIPTPSSKLDYIQNSLNQEKNDFSSLFSLYIFRHKLTKECSKDLIELLNIYKTNNFELRYNFERPSDLVEYSFCDCFNYFEVKRKQSCPVCKKNPKHFFTLNNFLEKTAEICIKYFKITDNNFNCEFSIFTDGISPFKKSNLTI